jgi:hypothetical protein
MYICTPHWHWHFKFASAARLRDRGTSIPSQVSIMMAEVIMMAGFSSSATVTTADSVVLK